MLEIVERLHGATLDGWPSTDNGANARRGLVPGRAALRQNGRDPGSGSGSQIDARNRTAEAWAGESPEVAVHCASTSAAARAQPSANAGAARPGARRGTIKSRAMPIASAAKAGRALESPVTPAICNRFRGTYRWT